MEKLVYVLINKRASDMRYMEKLIGMCKEDESVRDLSTYVDDDDEMMLVVFYVEEHKGEILKTMFESLNAKWISEEEA